MLPGIGGSFVFVLDKKRRGHQSRQEGCLYYMELDGTFSAISLVGRFRRNGMRDEHTMER